MGQILHGCATTTAAHCVEGIVGLMIGIGLLISAALSYRLCKTWGILTGNEKAQKS